VESGSLILRSSVIAASSNGQANGTTRPASTRTATHGLTFHNSRSGKPVRRIL
jgi:hypothetical protein